MASTTELVTDSVPDLTSNEPRTFGQLDIKQKLTYIREVITVEPLLGAYVMASTLCAPMLINLEYEKSCRVNLQMNDTVCEAILSSEQESLNLTDQNNEIQYLISNVHSWLQPVQSIMPLILVLFIGSYSDRRKWRKPFLLLPLFGELLSVAGCVLSVIFMRSWPLEVQGALQLVLPSLFGGQTMIVMATFAYIADVSTVEMRTLRIGVVQIVLNVVVPVTQLFSANMFELAGYYGVLFTAGALYLFGFLYGLFWIREPKPAVGTGERGVLCDVFDPRHAIDTFNLILKRVPGKNRVYIGVMLLTIFLYSAVVVGEAERFYFYSQFRFGWTIVEYSYFLSMNTLVHLIGTALAVPLFTKILNLSDITILLITFFDKMLSNVLFGFANSNTLLYVAAVVSLVTGVTPIGIRSLATKVVSENDLGKAQSLFGICEAIAPAIWTPVYNKGIYNNTLTTFPSAFFFFGIILYAICSAFMIWMYFREKVNRSSEVEVESGTGGAEKDTPMETIVETTHI